MLPLDFTWGSAPSAAENETALHRITVMSTPHMHTSARHPVVNTNTDGKGSITCGFGMWRVRS